MADFEQIVWDQHLQDDCRYIVQLAVREDLDRGVDLTTLSLIEQGQTGSANVVAREAGRVCGMKAAQVVVDQMHLDARWTAHRDDGDSCGGGDTLATIEGSARDLLTSERLILNLIGRLSGIATRTAEMVSLIEGTSCRLYDTRKTTPGFRRLEKYAVRCGGGYNHRTGLFDAVLIKDNHLALWTGQAADADPAAAVRQARQSLPRLLHDPDQVSRCLIEIEVDTLEQLRAVLAAAPDLVLLDNMPPELLRSAVALRNQSGLLTELEASGGITRDTIRAIAETGVERMSVGALTHSAVNLDVGLDWQ